MIINSRAATSVVGLTALLLLSVAPSGSHAREPRYEGTQLVRFVLATEKIPNYEEYRESIIDGTLTYDDEYRHPHVPPGPAPIDCEKTGRLGVTFLLQRKTRFHPETVTTYVFWTHSNVEMDKRVAAHNHQRHFKDGENGVIMSESLQLTDAMRVNGTISLRIVAGRQEILTNSFVLNSCPAAR